MKFITWALLAAVIGLGYIAYKQQADIDALGAIAELALEADKLQDTRLWDLHNRMLLQEVVYE